MDPDETTTSEALTVDGRCSTCAAPIAWAMTSANHKPIMLEPTSAADGNLRVERSLLGELVATVVAPGSEPVLYLPHFARCPDAAAHRNPRRTRA